MFLVLDLGCLAHLVAYLPTRAARGWSTAMMSRVLNIWFSQLPLPLCPPQRSIRFHHGLAVMCFHFSSNVAGWLVGCMGGLHLYEQQMGLQSATF